MRYNLVLGLVLAVLTGTAGLELIPRHEYRPQAPAAAAPGASAVAGTPEVEPSAAYIEQILARPLFTAGRRPAAAVEAPAAQPRGDKPPRLSGILVTGNDRRAIFESGGKPVVGGVGTQVGSYRILAITPQRVTLQGPAGVFGMSLSYGANDTATPVAAAPSLLDELNSGARPPPGMPKTPNLQQMMANLPKTAPPMQDGMPLNDTRPAR